MTRQLTPEEQRIIRQTEDEGRQIHDVAKTDHSSKRSGIKNLLTGILIYAGIFVLFAMAAYFIVSHTAM